jgi:Undecaprenyl-phosphate glucose phosphotransferase
MLFHFSELYSFEAIVKPLANVDKILIAFGTGFLFLLAAAFAFKVTATFSRTWLIEFALVSAVSTFAARFVISRTVSSLARRGVFTRNTVLVGSGVHIRRLLERTKSTMPDVVTIAGAFVDQPASEVAELVPILGKIDALEQFVRSNRVDDVIVALPWSQEDHILELVLRLRELPVDVYLASDLIGFRLDYREPQGHLASMPMFSVIGRPMSGWATAVKSLEDLLLGSILLVLLAIPMIAIAVLIRLESPGPILFRQRRLGFNNREFWIYKFRTMQHRQEESRTIQATKGDKRVTRVGRILRATSLDELPQLLNVLTGSMSLVGPRPHAVDHNEEYSHKIRGYFARHRVKPGITGWAQVNGLRGETDTEEKMEARVRYDENWSLIFDLRILVQTALVVITRKNAY